MMWSKNLEFDILLIDWNFFSSKNNMISFVKNGSFQSKKASDQSWIVRKYSALVKFKGTLQKYEYYCIT